MITIATIAPLMHASMVAFAWSRSLVYIILKAAVMRESTCYSTINNISVYFNVFPIILMKLVLLCYCGNQGVQAPINKFSEIMVCNFFTSTGSHFSCNNIYLVMPVFPIINNLTGHQHAQSIWDKNMYTHQQNNIFYLSLYDVYEKTTTVCLMSQCGDFGTSIPPDSKKMHLEKCFLYTARNNKPLSTVSC